MKRRIGYVVVGFLLFVLSIAAQTASSGSTATPVPPLVNFNGVLADANGKPLTGTVGVTFYLYQDQQGGAPLWLETQNVQADKTGHYSVALGSASSQGLPASVFAFGEARWLGVQVQGHTEQPRVLLMSVPYALKALDAETIGGKPASAFMMAPASNAKSQSPNLPPGTITGSGTADFVPVFTGASTIGNSKIFQTVAGDVGIGTTAPAAVLDVKGTGDVRDTLTLFPKSTHKALSVHGTAFDVSSTGLVTFVSGQTFPGAGTVTSVGSGAGLTGGPITTSGSLSIKTGGVTNAMLANSSLTVTANSPLTGGGPVSLGGSTSLSLKSCSTNQILQFVSGAWACANPATGTVTSVGSGLGLSGGPITGSGTLTINTSVVPQLAAANTFTANQTFTGEIAAGTGSGSSAGVLGESTATSGQTFGVGGFTSSPAGYGVEGLDVASSGGTAGYFQVNSGSATILQGNNGSTSEFLVDSAGDVYAEGVIVGGNSNSSTAGVAGAAYASSGQTYGVFGEVASPAGYGVLGANTSSGTPGTLSIGVVGLSQAGYGGVGVEGLSAYIGVLGTASGASNTSTEFGGLPGVWGDTGGAPETNYVGVVGTADDNSAGNFFNNSPQATLFLGNNSTANSTDLVLIAKGDNVGGLCTIDVSGNLSCNGKIGGAASVDSGARKVALYAMQSPENWFEDAGSGLLSNGSARIELDPTFAQTVNAGVEYHVFLTPKGDSEGLYVSNETPQGFEVHEQRGGHSNIAFDYRIMAKRVGYEKVRLADLTEQLNKQEAYRQKMRRPRPTAAPKASPRMPTLPVLPVRAAVRPLAVQPK
jgi:hypothetical protein